MILVLVIIWNEQQANYLNEGVMTEASFSDSMRSEYFVQNEKAAFPKICIKA